MTQLLAVTSLGVRFVVVLEGIGPDDAARLAGAWDWCDSELVDAGPDGAVPDGAFPGGAVPDGAVPDGHRMLVARLGGGPAGEPAAPDARPTLWADSLAELEDRLSGLITQQAIGARKEDLVLLHAGAVADPETGAVIAFVGPSGRGKTTASIALGSVFGYVTDETLGVDDARGVVPYGKPLSVKLPPPARWKRQSGPGELGLQRSPDLPLTLVGVVMLDRRTDLDENTPPVIRRRGLAEAIADLVPQVSYLPERARPLQRLGAIIEQCGGLRQVTYAEAATLPAVFRELFDEAGRRAGTTDDTLHAVFDDVIRDGDSLIVLTGQTVRVLDGIAPAVFEAAVPGCTPEQLTAAALRAFGPPPTGAGSAEALVAAAVDELVAAGLLRSSGVS